MIQTKVAKVLNPTSVILAAGSDDGVKEGMEFVIYDLSETILDPETGEDLGKLELVKGRVYAVHVQDKLTWAQTKSRTAERVVDPVALLAKSWFPDAFLYGKQTIKETISEQLKVEGPATPEFDRTVRVGDKVRSVYQPEFAESVR
jgi:hypothetical protein